MGTTINPFTGKIEQSSPPLRFNPLAGAFQFSGGTNRVVFDPVSGQFAFAKGAGDPIDGIPGLVQRWETRFPENFLTIGGTPAGPWEPVQSVVNMVPNGFTTNQPGAEDAMPLFAEAQVNGFPAMESDGINDFLISQPIDSNNQSVYILTRMLSGGGRAFGYLIDRSVGGFGPGGNWGYYASDPANIVDGGTPNTDWTLVGVHYDGANAMIECNGVETSFVVSNLSAGENLYLFVRPGGEFGNAQIAGQWRWDHMLTPSEMAIVRQYVSDIYNVP